jgi:hypothetical protein
MSLHIRIGPETVLAAHAPSPPASDSHYPAREDSAPVANRFFWMHGEFLCLLFLQETEAHFTADGMPSQRNQSESFRFKRAAFYQGLKSKVGLAAAKAAALRINPMSRDVAS